MPHGRAWTMAYVDAAGLKVARSLYDFINGEALPGTGIDAEAFWKGLASLVEKFGGRNKELLAKRDRLQAQIDDWHRENRGKRFDQESYESFPRSISYLVPEPPDFTITTANVDPEIAKVAGPQLVVPVTNPRYALNAANARWGSLYDALYGTDALPSDTAAIDDASSSPPS